MSEAPRTWKLSLVTDKSLVPALEDALAGLDLHGVPPVIATFEVEEDSSDWTIEAFFDGKPDHDQLAMALHGTASALGVPCPCITLKPVADRDWVRESQKHLKPISAGQFYVYGRHDAETLPPGKTGLMIDAGQAFGSGSHETTRGCLLMLDELAHGKAPGRVLDLGCGSGILAIASTRIWDCLAVGSDIDPVATATATQNAHINGVNVVSRHAETHGFLGLTSAGFQAPELRSLSPFDLIIANILMEPLIELAPGITKALSPGGQVILSGLLDSQEDHILEIYAAQGLKYKKRVPLNKWHTLLLQK